ncbi:MAG TPA: hypothetical protein VNS55_09340 [Nocardioides sp.]|nr:hypothetical protein [Nocardioides sp.]
MHLNCPDEVARYVGATLREILFVPAVEAQLDGRPMRVRVGLVDPDCVLYVDTALHDVRIGSAADTTDALIAMDGDTALACLLGQVDIEEAIESGAVVTAGDVVDLLRFLGSEPSVRDACAAVLQREGRTDLLALAS